MESIGIHKEIVFRTLRACFATHLLSMGVEPLKVMRMGGWSDLKTFQIYLRLSGVDVKGVAEGDKKCDPAVFVVGSLLRVCRPSFFCF